MGKTNIEDRSKREIDLICTSLIIGQQKNLLKGVQELLMPTILNKTSIDIDTISKIEVLLDTNLLVFDDDKIKKIERRKKLEQLQIVSGEVTPIKVFLNVDDKTGIVELKYEK